MAKKQVQINQEFVQKFIEKDGYPEVGHFKDDQKSLQKFYKHCTVEQLQEWVELEGLTDQVKPTDSEQIYRMRLCMAILYKHYPKPPAKSKKAKYADFTLEKLVELASENDVPVEPCDDERILRMRVIMSLRAHKIIE